MKKRFLKAVVVASVLAVGGLFSANAVPTLLFSTDRGATWVPLGPNGTVGSWRVTATAFSTVGDATRAPELGFSSFNAISRLPGSLLVRLSDTGFDWDDQTGYFLSSLDGSVSGGSRLSVSTYVNSDLLTSQGNFFAGTLDNDAVNTTHGVPTGPFSMMFEASILQRIGGGRVALSSSLIDPAAAQVPDGGSTLMLLGAGLGLLAILKRDRKHSA